MQGNKTATLIYCDLFGAFEILCTRSHKKPPWSLPGGFFSLNQINLTNSKNYSHEKTNQSYC